jgi:hypothetical protein
MLLMMENDFPMKYEQPARRTTEAESNASFAVIDMFGICGTSKNIN